LPQCNAHNSSACCIATEIFPRLIHTGHRAGPVSCPLSEAKRT
jgi:hypothetical protein